MDAGRELAHRAGAGGRVARIYSPAISVPQRPGFPGRQAEASEAAIALAENNRRIRLEQQERQRERDRVKAVPSYRPPRLTRAAGSGGGYV